MGVSTGKNTRFPNGEFSINCHSEEPVLGNAWELIENSKRGNLHFGTRWESKIQVWKLSAGSLTEKRKLIQYWDTPQKNQCKIPALGTKVPELEFNGTYKIKKYPSVKNIKNSQSKTPVSAFGY